MNRKRIIIKLWLLVALLLSVLPMSAYDFQVEGVYYKVLSDKTSVAVTYRSTNYDSYIGEVVIPSEVSNNGKSYRVTTIGSHAFSECTLVTSITLPPSITNIELYAFEGATHIQKVHISNLSAWCMIEFTGRSSSPLAYGGMLYLNNSPVSSLESLDSSCTTIGKYAFWGNTLLINAILPESIKSVQDGAFKDCKNLKYLEVGANTTSLGEGAFAGCSSLNIIKFVDSDKKINLGRYEYGKIYKYFKDCPLETVYVGREVTWDASDTNYEYFYPFTGVKNAIFNIEEDGTVYSAFGNNLTSVYLGAKCKEFTIESRYLKKLYVFTDNIKYAYLESSQAEIFVKDKTDIPEKIALLNSQSIDNLIDLKNLNNGDTFIYGSFPNIESNNFENHVEGMEIDVKLSSSESDAGYHDKGIPIVLQNALWSVTVDVPFTYTVEPAPVTIIANDVSRKYGTENPELTCSFFGFKNGETKDVLTHLPNVETTATLQSNVGTYPIIATGAEAKNYTFSYERGTLTITKADQEIEWEQLFSNVNVGDVIELTATSSSGLPIKYSTTDETIADIFSQGGKKCVEFLKPGNVAIRATQEGDNNYNEADRVSKSIKVSLLVSGITLNHTSYTLAEDSSVQLVASIIPDNASNKALNWESANPNIASVDATGKVTAISQGVTTITVKTTDGSNIAATCEINVIRLATSISLNFQRLSAEVGSKYQLIATVLPEDATNKDVVWSSSDEKVATVDKNGLVSVISKGICAITAATVDGSNLKAECEIQIYSGIEGISHDESSDIILVKNGVIHVVNKDPNALVRVFSTQGILILETFDNEVGNLESGLYIVTIGNKRIKVKL